ncbi:MAG: RNA polymerase sigma factor [Paludibacter sp.]|nr:RNA polymerase sigma factor [Paludibacter sp.]
MENLDELSYIKRILEGDTNLFSVFLERYSRSIHSLIVRIIPSNEDAEELTQDTFLKAFRKLDTFKGECSFSTWLFRIAYNTAISATRKKKYIFPVIDDSMLENVSDETMDLVFGDDEDENRLQLLEEAIAKLNVEEKTLITLYYSENKSIAEIAGMMELTTDNVKVKLFRVRKKLYVLMNK